MSFFLLAFGRDNYRQVLQWCRANNIPNRVETRARRDSSTRQVTLPTGGVNYCIAHNISCNEVLRMCITNLRAKFLELDDTLSASEITCDDPQRLRELLKLYNEGNHFDFQRDMDDLAETFRRAGPEWSTLYKPSTCGSNWQYD